MGAHQVLYLRADLKKSSHIQPIFCHFGQALENYLQTGGIIVWRLQSNRNVSDDVSKHV